MNGAESGAKAITARSLSISPVDCEMRNRFLQPQCFLMAWRSAITTAAMASGERRRRDPEEVNGNEMN